MKINSYTYMNSKSNKQPRTNFSNLNLTETLITYLCRNFVGDLRCRKTLLEEDDEDGEENKGSSIYKPDARRGVKAFMVI